MVSKVTEVLHEYQDLFSTKFLEMKGILGDIGVIKIPLKADVKPVKQRPYRLNPKYKEKVRMELDKMLTAVTKRNSYGLGYHNRQLDSKNQSFPICNRNKNI